MLNVCEWDVHIEVQEQFKSAEVQLLKAFERLGSWIARFYASIENMCQLKSKRNLSWILSPDIRWDATWCRCCTERNWSVTERVWEKRMKGILTAWESLNDGVD